MSCWSSSALVGWVAWTACSGYLVELFLVDQAGPDDTEQDQIEVELLPPDQGWPLVLHS